MALGAKRCRFGAAVTDAPDHHCVITNPIDHRLHIGFTGANLDADKMRRIVEQLDHRGAVALHPVIVEKTGTRLTAVTFAPCHKTAVKPFGAIGAAQWHHQIDIGRAAQFGLCFD